jgi:hypothetical protein
MDKQYTPTQGAHVPIKQIQYSDLRLNEKVTLKLRDGESVIVGKVTTLPTPGGNAKVTLTNNKNSVVVTPETNFRIFADRQPTAADVLDGLSIGATFTYLNRFGKRKSWVKSGTNRYTRIDANNDRPAVSFTKLGFPSEDASVVRITTRF